MAYTTIDNPELYFQTKLFTGTGSSNSVTLDGSENMRPDWVWIKNRDSGSLGSQLHDVIRGTTKRLFSNSTDAEETDANGLTAFNSNGFTLGSNVGVNQSSSNMVAWNWSAGGSAPAITYSVKVVSDSGNKYRFDDFGTSAVTLDLQEGGTYTFDQSDSSNSGHPLRFSTTSNGTHGGGSEYTTGVTTTGTPGSSGAKTVITVSASAPTLYYYCTQHSGMGGQANTNSTFGSSNFSGSIQSTVSAGSTQGFSVVTYTGNGTSGATVGHGLSNALGTLIVKSRSEARNWAVFHQSNGGTKNLSLDTTDAVEVNAGRWNNTAPTSSVFTLGNSTPVNNNGITYVAYCLAEKKGYSKFGSYTGNGNVDGTFIYTGFKPAWVMIKPTSYANSWLLLDNKRPGFNVTNQRLEADGTGAEYSSLDYADFLSNGFKIRTSNAHPNNSGGTLIYMAFAESPFVNSNGVPTNAR